MLIDDDEDDQHIFLSALKELTLSIVCHVASNGRKALEHLNSGAVKPELIFLDLNMPVMNGQQFLQLIKQDAALKKIPVIIFSTSSNPVTIEEVMELGARDFITKPDHFDQLREILRITLL